MQPAMHMLLSGHKSVRVAVGCSVFFFMYVHVVHVHVNIILYRYKIDKIALSFLLKDKRKYRRFYLKTVVW